jgi:methylmalonyl-CoA mutase N-terminal domain/subunit
MVVVGVNEYVLPEELPIETLQIDQGVADAQRRSLAVLRAQRDNARVTAALQRLQEAARGATNLVPLILEAVECYTTLGEISDALREVFGEYRERVSL